ncbi:MAG: 50S ribosomal protein L18 [Patescibacteria group bacterium]|jgi:large subunit ribosomal protein L18
MVKKVMHNSKLNNKERAILAVKRTNKHIYCDIVDQNTGLVLDSASDADIKTGTKTEKSAEVGKLVANLAKEHNITKVVFDRKGYKFHGRVKMLADSARKNGLEF